VEELAKAIEAHSVVIVAGETGSGKTTQLPKICLAMGRANGRQIGCTQPRRIAATSVAARVAQELDTPLGEVVGYKVRFTDRVKPTSAIKFMTDGMLLAEIQGDPMLRTYDTIIIDEAHERSLNIDFLLGFVKRLVERRRDLRIVISSATLEIERFTAFFGGAPVVQVSGRTYPVDVIYRPPGDDEPDVAEHVANVVNEITELDPRGDVLVFLPGEREIREAIGELEQRALPHTELLPLYARLSVAEQQRVFQPGGRRRVVLATNVAETSLTIPGIVYVVDPGFARVNRYDVRTGVSQLLVEPISRASADQRKGRCGRVQSGVCFRLYEEQDFASRPAHTDPEIKRVGLAGVILRMMALGLGDIAAFPFLDPPQTRAIGEGYRTLEELGALDEQRALTPIGEQLGRLPLDPRLGRMILGGVDERALREVVTIASVLGLQDPRERPLAERQRADEAHRKFRDEGSDFVGYLKLWADWREASERLSRRQLQKWCRDHFLSYVRMREWDDIHEQIVRVMRDLEFAPNAQPASGEQIHRALLPGLLSKIGMWNPEARNYLGARQTRFVIHPASALGKKPPTWVMAAELVETSQLFARTVAKLDPVWVEAVAGSLCRRSHGDPHWEQKAGQVIAREQVTLFGLPIVKSRPVPFALHDPALCRELFITHALCRHEYVTKGAFMEHNRAMQEEVQHLRSKARKSDMFADEEALFAFFDRKLPASVVSGKTFEAWRREAEPRDPKALFLSLDDLLVEEDRGLTPARYPDELVVGGARMPLAYRFDPGEDDDGITVTVPLAVLPQLDPAVMTWTIPGWHRAKIVALLDSLSKSRRKSLGAAVDELADTLTARLRPFDGPMLPALEAAVLDVTGERVGRDQWDTIPPYLHFTFRVVDDQDKPLGSSRDLAELQRELAGRAQKLWAAAPRASFEKKNLRGWDFDALPESVTIEVSGRRVAAYPALVDVESSVELRLLESPAAARAASRAGLRRLFVFQAQLSMTKLEAQLPAMLTRELRKDLVNRALDEAFDLDGTDLPRDRAAFAHRLAEGRGLVAGILAELARFASETATHTAKIQATLRPLVGKPGMIRGLVDDVQSQLAHLITADLWRTASLARLGHIARYLQALQIRLQRQSHDPQKDAQKAAPVIPIWQAFLARRAELEKRGRRPEELEQFRWLIEELRVQVFAPELRTPMPVSLPRIQDLWAALVR
jgi:ATP-dependent helicase HrpA